MNVYEVLSEEVEYSPVRWDPPEPAEHGRCWHLVAAPSAAAAKRAALVADGLWERDVRDLPRCSIRKLATGVTARSGIVSDSYWANALIPEHQPLTWAEYISAVEEWGEPPIE